MFQPAVKETPGHPELVLTCPFTSRTSAIESSEDADAHRGKGGVCLNVMPTE